MLNAQQDFSVMKDREHLPDDALLAFLERGEKLPPRVTNAMLLLALRAERQARQADVESLRARLDVLVRLMQGLPGRPGGLLQRVEALERTARWAGAVLWPAALAFLGAAGAWLFALLVNE
jgi:hypothetical protein